VLAGAASVALACGPGAAGGNGTSYRAYTDHYSFRITADPAPPHAREKTKYTIVVRDKNTGQPIEGGEGMIYANTRDETGKTWDTFVPGQAPGTYNATLDFVVADDQWAIGLQFRRDSTSKLEKVDTWYQTVLPERATIP
jgi:hypothetical protein